MACPYNLCFTMIGYSGHMMAYLTPIMVSQKFTIFSGYLKKFMFTVTRSVHLFFEIM